VTRIVPSLPEVTREALILIGGALLAALIVAQFPGVKQWMREQWQ
jgi:hypothetical protein